MTRTKKSQEPRIHSHLVRSPGDSPAVCLARQWGKEDSLLKLNPNLWDLT